MDIRVAIEYTVIVLVSVGIALLYSFAAGAAFLPALLVGLGLLLGVVFATEILRREQVLRNWTVLLLVVTFISLLAWYRFG